MPIDSDSECLREDESCFHAAGNQHVNGMTVECICPKCGTKHKMKLLWSGRGKPKKYCPPCKSFVATLEPIDFCGIPADINKSIEKAV